jgi:hypothetical protein
MAKCDWLGLLSSALLVVVPATVHSGELTKGNRAAFAIRHAGSCGDVKTRLWNGCRSKSHLRIRPRFGPFDQTRKTSPRQSLLLDQQLQSHRVFQGNGKPGPESRGRGCRSFALRDKELWKLDFSRFSLSKSSSTGSNPFLRIQPVRAAITVVFPTPPLPPGVNSICDRCVIRTRLVCSCFPVAASRSGRWGARWAYY